jgi:hypothetical protein
LATDVPLASRQEVRQRVAGLYRHLGRYDDATRTARAAMKRDLRCGIASSYDAQARSAAEYAASLYDPHRFEEMVRVLEPWRHRLIEDPLKALPLTRVAVLNTLGRAQVVLQQDGWEDNFSRSLTVLAATDPHDQARTINYRIHGLLRANRLQHAAKWMERVRRCEMSEFSRWHLLFAQAELARRREQVWEDEEIERQDEAECPAGHPFGFYFQATARQHGRSVEDATDRFRRAEQFFRRDVDSGDPGNIQVFLAACMRLAEAAWLDDVRIWREVVSALSGYANGRKRRALANYYRDVLPQLGSLPSVAAVQTLLSRVPYF